MLQVILFILVPLTVAAQSCPQQCQCNEAASTVDCSNRNLKSVPWGIPEWVRTLNLSRNQISYIDPMPFYSLSNLRELSLSNNYLARLPDDAFLSNSRLYSIHLDNNYIQSLTIAQIRRLGNIRMLDIHSNNVNNPQAELLTKYLPSLVSLRMDGNPVVCSCDILSMQTLLDVIEDASYPATCTYPSSLSGQQIKTLNASFIDSQCPNQKPFMETSPESQAFMLGTSAKLFCMVQGKPTPTVAWYKESQLITGSDGRIVPSEDGTTLHFSSIQSSDAGTYKCLAVNSLGKVESPAVISTTSSSASSSNAAAFIRIVENANTEAAAVLGSSSPASVFQKARIGIIYDRAVEDIKQQYTGQAKNTYITNLLSTAQKSTVVRLSGCPAQTAIDCSQRKCFNGRFRSIDGTCNNLKKPRQGASLTPLLRRLKSQYEDGVDNPIGWQATKTYGGYTKPSARLVSSRLLSASSIPRRNDFNGLLMEWGQFLDHDISLTTKHTFGNALFNALKCNSTCGNRSPCFPIVTPPNDTRVTGECMAFDRSIADCGTGSISLLEGTPRPRQQVNEITSYIDASMVYGSTVTQAEWIRNPNYEGGKLKEGVQSSSNARLLPYKTPTTMMACQVNPNYTHVPCYLAGDKRANENIGLASLHTLWMREHNRIVTILHNVNPHWSGKRLYYEGRKILGAMMQIITYEEWLPKIFGRQGMKTLGTKYKGYDDTVDASVSNAFATAAFRFGHALLDSNVFRLNSSYMTIAAGNLPLHKGLFAPFRLKDEGGIDPVLRGFMKASMKAPSPRSAMTTELTDKMFELTSSVAQDLGAMNTQRGRDHGLPGYVEWRRFCGLSVPKTFHDLRFDMTDGDVRERLRQVYGNPENIDLFIGGVLEEPLPDALVGPTFSCLLIDQFKRLRSGDRFWYERENQFSPNQLAELRKVSFSRVICDSSDNIKRVVRDAFETPTRYQSVEQFAECTSIPGMDLSKWKDYTGNTGMDESCVY